MGTRFSVTRLPPSTTPVPPGYPRRDRTRTSPRHTGGTGPARIREASAPAPTGSPAPRPAPHRERARTRPAAPPASPPRHRRRSRTAGRPRPGPSRAGRAPGEHPLHPAGDQVTAGQADGGQVAADYPRRPGIRLNEQHPVRAAGEGFEAGRPRPGVQVEDPPPVQRAAYRDQRAEQPLPGPVTGGPGEPPGRHRKPPTPRRAGDDPAHRLTPSPGIRPAPRRAAR